MSVIFETQRPAVQQGMYQAAQCQLGDLVGHTQLLAYGIR